MENLIYSLNATLPVFLTIVVGWLLRRQGMLTDEFVAVANRLNFQVTLPVMLFCDMVEMDLRSVFDLGFFLFCLVATTLCFFTIWGASHLFMKEKNLVGSFVQGSFRGSSAVLGTAFIQNIYGTAGMAPLVIMASAPLYNLFSVLVLTFEGQGLTGSAGQKMKKALGDIVTNPLILGIAAGAGFALSGIQMPQIVGKTLSNIAAMSTPLALVAIGAGFELRSARARLGPTLVGSFIKLVAQTTIFMPVAIVLGFRGQALIAILVLLGAPTTPSSYIMAQNMNNDGVLANSLVVCTTLFSSLTVTGWIFLLRALGVV